MLPDSPVFQPGSRAQLRQQTASMSSDLSAPISSSSRNLATVFPSTFACFAISRRRPTSAHDLKPRLAESFVEAGKDVAVVAFGADFVFPANDQNVSLEQVINAPNYHRDTRRRLISSSSQSKATSTGIKVSATHQMIPSRAAISNGVMAPQGSFVLSILLDKRQPRGHH
jgi:hypothetical protein